TWSQAKALWWRNPWFLKLKRAILIPRSKSLYGELRREPRGECLSTIESIAQSLTHLGEDPSLESELTDYFQKLLSSYRAGYGDKAPISEGDESSGSNPRPKRRRRRWNRKPRRGSA